MGSKKKIVVEPVTRVEGHGKVTVLVDEAGKPIQTRLHIVEFRGFERFIIGRPFWEIPVLVQRLCGICPVSHHLAAAKAMDQIVGARSLTPTAEKIRRLMHYGQILQSHALHFFHLASPDLLFGFDAAPPTRNVVGVARRFPELAKQGILLRKYGQEVIRATSGKRIHGTGAIPGGVNKSLRTSERDLLLKGGDSLPGIHDVLSWSQNAVKIAGAWVCQNLEKLRSFGSFDSNHLSIVSPYGTLDLYDGKLRAIDTEGKIIFDQVEPERYLEFLAEEVRPWSYMKFPFIKTLGPEKGWYRVGPLARMNTCERIDTEEAEKARIEFHSSLGGRPCNITLAYHWARMIELLHAAEKIHLLLNDKDLLGSDLVVKGERQYEAVGVIEAPRGTLIHHYQVDELDRVRLANLIVATTNNNEPMNRAVSKVAQDYFKGGEISEGLLNRIEVAIRAYDPCLSCATHALGQMALEVELRNKQGNLLDRKVRP